MANGRRRRQAVGLARQHQGGGAGRTQQGFQEAPQLAGLQLGAGFTQATQVGHLQQWLGRQQQGLVRRQHQAVLDLRQLGLAAQGIVTAHQGMQRLLLEAQQADRTRLEELRLAVLHQQQTCAQLGHALPGLAAAEQLQVERRQHLPRRLGLAPALRSAGVVGEEGVQVISQHLHHVGAGASPEQGYQQQWRTAPAPRHPGRTAPCRLAGQIPAVPQSQAHGGVFQ
ncbi:hypothetical protein D3C84_505950 [compost metagenome]